MIVYQTKVKFKGSCTKYIMCIVDGVVGDTFLLFSIMDLCIFFVFWNCSIQCKYFTAYSIFVKDTLTIPNVY